MTDRGWFSHLKAVLRPWIPAQVLSAYRQFREPLRLVDRSEVILFADERTLPYYEPRRSFSSNMHIAGEDTHVTLVATIYNEAYNVTRWLDSIGAQRRMPDEVVITDGGSTDGTLDILKHHAKNFPVPMKVISHPGANISEGRNLAIKAASHDVIVCSDCGSILDENWLHSLVAPFVLDPQIGVSAGYYDIRETNTLSRLARQFFGVDLTKINPQEFLPSGRSLAFQKKLWERAGEYPEWLTDAGEDTLFDMRLKTQPARWAFVPSARAAWYAPDSFPKLLKTYYRYSRGDGETGISAELYWYKVVELLRVWPRRIVMLIAGLLLVGIWPLVGVMFFGAWLAWSTLCFWRRNRPYANTLGLRFYPGTVLLEVVGTVQAVGFTLGVLSRRTVRIREIKYYQSKITELVVKYPDRKGIIVYPPTHDWGFMFQRPHQIARAFARQGWVYFFCTENSRSDAIFGFQEVESGLVLSHVPEETFRVLKNPVVYLGSAWNRPYLKYFDAPKVIYDHYDDLVVSGANQDDHIALLNEADIVLVTAQRLLEAVRSHRDDALLIPNGVDYDFIQSVRPQSEVSPPDDIHPILALRQPIVGYSGALAEWFDYDLLTQAAQKYVDYSFVLVGVDYDGSLERSGVLDFPNVSYLGMKKYAELFEYVWRFDIALIPFKVNDITLATSPVKLYEYMACKKPVVVTDLPECRTFSEIFLAENDTQFVSLISDAIKQKDNTTFQNQLERLAQENTWKARVEKISYRLLTKM